MIHDGKLLNTNYHKIVNQLQMKYGCMTLNIQKKRGVMESLASPTTKHVPQHFTYYATESGGPYTLHQKCT